MNLLSDSASLIQLDNLYLAVSLEDTLMIGQSSEIISSDGSDNTIGSFDYANSKLPTYHLDNKLVPSNDKSGLEQNNFCIGLRTRQESDYFVLLCKQFEQIDLSEKSHNMRELPSFMCKQKMLVKGMLEHQNLVYLITSPDSVLDYIASNGAGDLSENNNA